jgi:hypothetical protein
VLDVDHGSTREPGAEGAIGQSSCQRKGLVAIFFWAAQPEGKVRLSLEMDTIALVSEVVQAVCRPAVRLGPSSWSGFPKRRSATPNRPLHAPYRPRRSAHALPELWL